MKKKQLKMALGLSFINCLLPLCATLISCSSDDDDEQGTEQSTDGRKLRQLTIADVPMTRAMLSNEGTTLDAKWKAEDDVTFLNISNIPTSLNYSPLTASNSAANSAFTGSVTCDNNDSFAIIYPDVTPERHVDANGARVSFPIDLTKQDGTLATLAQSCHYVFGKGMITSVTDHTATGTVTEMQSLLAVCRFIFKDKTTSEEIKVKEMKIGYEDAIVGYPLTGIGEVSSTGDITVTPAAQEAWTSLLSITLDTETSDGVYVALFPVNVQDDFYFSVTGSKGIYTGMAKAKLLAGKYYPVELKLTKQ